MKMSEISALQFRMKLPEILGLKKAQIFQILKALE